MSKYLGCFLLFQISFCCASDLHRQDEDSQLVRRRIELVLRLQQWHDLAMAGRWEELAGLGDDDLVNHRQNAVDEIPSSDLSTKADKAGFVFYDGDMYKDGFDKIWDCEDQDQALLVKKQEQQKYDMWRLELLNGEPERKRRRIEN